MSRPSFRREVFEGHLPGTRLFPRHFFPTQSDLPKPPSCFQDLGLMAFSPAVSAAERQETHTQVWRGRCDTTYCKAPSKSSHFLEPPIPERSTQGGSGKAIPAPTYSTELRVGGSSEVVGLSFLSGASVPNFAKALSWISWVLMRIHPSLSAIVRTRESEGVERRVSEPLEIRGDGGRRGGYRHRSASLCWWLSSNLCLSVWESSFSTSWAVGMCSSSFPWDVMVPSDRE